MTLSATYPDAASPDRPIRAAAPTAVRVWLYAVAALVFAMVLVGGATRLTDSGLSITEWKPVTGAIPPLSHEAWMAAFEKYRQIPEYTRINKGMSLAEFQTIYWWEWAHRFLGRLIGLAFALPALVFWMRGMIPRWLAPRLAVLFALGGLQGAVGWYMVASGLVDRVDVSQYRLAMHLTLAAIILAAIIWVAREAKGAQQAKGVVAPAVSAGLQAGGLALAGLVLVQIYLGALVAGLDAGLTYTTWPLMDGRFIPPATKLLVMEPAWRNVFENVLTVQFVHRMTAYALLACALLYGVWQWRRGAGRTGLVVAGLVVWQAGVGITTLILEVPLGWALLHQGSAFVVLALAVVNAQGLFAARRLEGLEGFGDLGPARLG